ncbi:MAG: DinB family protein [Gemmatimonadales bacterium]
MAQFRLNEAIEGKTLDELLDTFASLRVANLRTLATKNLQPEELDRRGTHPELSSVTVRQLLATWVAHDLGHIAQIARVMAKRYSRGRRAVERPPAHPQGLGG